MLWVVHAACQWMQRWHDTLWQTFSSQCCRGRGRSGWILTLNELYLTFRVPNYGAKFHQIVENFGHIGELTDRHADANDFIISHFYQRVSIASYANRWYSQRRNVRLSVRPSHCGIVSKRRKLASWFFHSLRATCQNILVSRNIWIITKFDRGHPERGRFLRLGWVLTGDFGNFSTNKPPYLRNGAR